MIKWPYKYHIALIYTITLFLDRLDLTVVNVALPTVAQYFHVSITQTDWANIAFLLALAISIPTSSWLGERFGLKKIYLIAMLLFGLGSTLCAIAPSLLTITLLRFIQGIGGGLLIPVGMTMIYRIYEPTEYASITSFTFMPALLAPAIAPFLGGILLQSIGWRMVFLFSGPIVLVLFMYACFMIQKDEAHSDVRPLDFLGVFLVTALLIAIFLTLSRVGNSSLLGILLGFLVSILLLILFIGWQKKCVNPLFNLSVFHNASFVRANVLQLCFQFVHFGAIFLVGMYLQVGLGMSAILAGFIMGMQALGAIAINRYSVKLFNQYGIKKPVGVGLLGIAVISPMILLIHQPSSIVLGSVLFFMRGLCSGLCGVPIQTLSVIHFEKQQLAQINSIFNTCRQVSISLGIAVSSMLIAWGLKLNHVTTQLIANYPLALHVFYLGFVMITVVALLGAYLAQKDRNSRSGIPISTEWEIIKRENRNSPS